MKVDKGAIQKCQPFHKCTKYTFQTAHLPKTPTAKSVHQFVFFQIQKLS